VTKTKAEIAAEIRSQAYRYGSVLRKTARNRKTAELEAFKLGQTYPPDEYGIRFEGRRIPNTADWAVYAFTVPLLGRGEVWTDEKVDMLAGRVQKWGLALVREFNTAGSAKTTANRDNLDMAERWPALAELGVRFKSQVVWAAHGKSHYAVYAWIRGRETAAAANLREAAG
jgi:hypothetical protein